MGHRLAVAKKFINQGYSICKVLKYFKLHRTSWYRHVNKEKLAISCRRSGRPAPGYSYSKYGNKVLDEKIISEIKRIREEETYLMLAGGYKKLKYYLYNSIGVIVNKKKVYRLCKENNLLFPRKRKTKHSHMISRNRVVSKPHQVWEFDIKYGYIHGENRFFYILVYIDVFSRAIIHYYVGLQCKAKHLVSTFCSALRKSNLDYNHGLVIRSDNGPQMTSKQFCNYLAKDIRHKVMHEFIPCSTPNKNAHVESFYSIIESEFIPVHYFKTFKDVYIKLTEFINFYNNKRVHGSLRYRTPNEVLELFSAGQIPGDITPSKI